MKLAHLDTGDGLRLAIAGDDGWVDVAQASGDPRLQGLSGLIAAGPDALASVAELAGGSGTAAADAPLGSLLDRPGRIFCVGRNYVAHRDEFKNRPSEWPEVFLRLPSTVTGPYADVPVPATSDRFDFEGEMGVVIGAAGRHIPAATAEAHPRLLRRQRLHRARMAAPGRPVDRRQELRRHAAGRARRSSPPTSWTGMTRRSARSSPARRCSRRAPRS